MPPRFGAHIHLIIRKRWRWCRDVLQGMSATTGLTPAVLADKCQHTPVHTHPSTTYNPRNPSRNTTTTCLSVIHILHPSHLYIHTYHLQSTYNVHTNTQHTISTYPPTSNHKNPPHKYTSGTHQINIRLAGFTTPTTVISDSTQCTE